MGWHGPKNQCVWGNELLLDGDRSCGTSILILSWKQRVPQVISGKVETESGRVSVQWPSCRRECGPSPQAEPRGAWADGTISLQGGKRVVPVTSRVWRVQMSASKRRLSWVLTPVGSEMSEGGFW